MATAVPCGAKERSMLAAIDQAELLVAALAAEPSEGSESELAAIRETFQDLLSRGYPPRTALSLALRMELAPATAGLAVVPF
jgi:hypothetical protein